MPDLAACLESLGVDVRNEVAGEVIAPCPMHEKRTGKRDRHPSWSMNTLTGAHYCFACGYKGGLVHLVCDLRGVDAFQAARWIRQEGLRLRDDPPSPPVLYRAPEALLAGFEPPPDTALESRRIERFAAAHYGVLWAPQDGAWVLPVRTAAGVLLGYQIKTKRMVRTVPPGTRKSRTLFGLHVLPRGQRAVLVESPLDVVRLYSEGIEGGLASMGAMVSKYQLRLIEEHARSVVVALDNDAAGRLQAARLQKEWGARFPVSFFAYGASAGKDIGELERAEILLGLESAVHSSVWRP